MHHPKTAYNFPDSKVRGDNMGSTWVLSAPDEPHVGPINLAIMVSIINILNVEKTDLEYLLFISRYSRVMLLEGINEQLVNVTLFGLCNL